jgi:hypothetical protein
VNVNDSEIVLKIKKALPKPGKEESKVDDKFCALDLDEKYWERVKEVFFWDVPEGKKCKIKHDVIIEDVEIPSDVSAEKVRELAVRKGKIVRKIEIDGKAEEKIYELKV